jgi:hypothetical protein
VDASDNPHFGRVCVRSVLAGLMNGGKKETPKSVKSPRGLKRPRVIRLDELLPKEDVKGGAGRPAILFGQVEKGKLGPKKT